jgi:uncharacterized protein (DUF58 family)
VIAALRRALLRWQERLPRSDTALLGQRNVYILPTRAGIAFGATLLLMLLASINYQLSLGYALTFLLAGAGAVSLHQTHATLRGLTLHLRPPAPVFAGDPAALELVLTSPGAARHGLSLHLRGGALLHGAPSLAADDEPAPAWTDVPAQGQATVRLTWVPAHRGRHELPTVVVATRFPFGLFRAWALWRPASQVLAWPRPEQPAPPLPGSASPPGGERAQRRGAGGELDGVRPFQRGDTLRQVVWKKVARSGELVSRETAGGSSRELWLDWADSAGAARPTGTVAAPAAPGASAAPPPTATPADPQERRLARLAAWALQAEQQQLAYGLRLPGLRLEPAAGGAQQRAVLEALALWR